MKKLCVFLMALLAGCSGCAHLPWTGRTSRADVSESVFQIKNDIEVNPDPYCADAKDGDGNDDSANCVKRLHEELGGSTYHFRFMGTAWISGHVKSRTQVVTAGHLCETRKNYEYVTVQLAVKDGMLVLEKKVYQLPILSVKYKLAASDGTETEGLQVRQDNDETDVCSLTAPGDLGAALRIADDDPEYGERCYYIGAPMGIWGDGVAMIAETTFAGRWQPEEGPEMLAFSGAVAGGASGSPMICDGKVVGVLDRGGTRFPFILAADSDAIRDLLSHKGRSAKK